MIKSLSGHEISLAAPESIDEAPKKDPWENATAAIAIRQEAEFLQLLKEIADTAESLHNIGIWYVNKSTGTAYYSNHVFRIHGLPAQSLNAHANTFHPFIHPEDRVMVIRPLA